MSRQRKSLLNEALIEKIKLERTSIPGVRERLRTFAEEKQTVILDNSVQELNVCIAVLDLDEIPGLIMGEPAAYALAVDFKVGGDGTFDVTVNTGQGLNLSHMAIAIVIECIDDADKAQLSLPLGFSGNQIIAAFKPITSDAAFQSIKAGDTGLAAFFIDLTSPIHDKEGALMIGTATPTFGWQRALNAAKYSARVGRDSECTNNVFSEDTENQSVTVSELTWGDTLFVCVNAHLVGGGARAAANDGVKIVIKRGFVAADVESGKAMALSNEPGPNLYAAGMRGGVGEEGALADGTTAQNVYWVPHKAENPATGPEHFVHVSARQMPPGWAVLA